jgi:hypothetical protein
MPYALADIVALRGRGRFSKLILRFTNDTVSHVGMIISTHPLLVIEAVSRVKTHPIYTMVEDAERMYLIHHKHLTDEDRVEIVEACCKWSARSYGWGKIALQGLDVMTKSQWFSEKFGGSDRPYCSWVVAIAYKLREVLFGEAAETVRPDEILAWAVAHPELYEVEEFIFAD